MESLIAPNGFRFLTFKSTSSVTRLSTENPFSGHHTVQKLLGIFSVNLFHHSNGIFRGWLTNFCTSTRPRTAEFELPAEQPEEVWSKLAD
jgi:hypothetical protein